VEILETLKTRTAGSVTVLGLDIERDVREIRRRIGVLPQAFNSFELLSVRETLRFFADMYDRSLDVDEVIAQVELGSKRDEMFKNLSGGLKQRVGVAISMVNDPDIVFLDEPTTGLDPKARREVWEVVKGLRARGKTVILTTHYMEEAEVLSDRVAIMSAGRFIAMGTPQELIDRHGSGATCVVRNGGEAAFEALKEMGAESRGGDVHVPLPSRDALPEAVRRLEASGAYYDEVLMKRPTLEDVFLKLTGARMTED